MSKIQIQNHCTPDQATQLYDAITDAGLEYPDIDWEFFYEQDKKEVFERLSVEIYHENVAEEYRNLSFTPCPTLAELFFLFQKIVWTPENISFESYFNNCLGVLESHFNFDKKGLEKDWSRLQNKENE